MSIKKRSTTGNAIPRVTGTERLRRESKLSKELEGDKTFQPEAKDAFMQALEKAKENKKKAETIRVDERKAKPTVAEGRYTAITVDAKLEKGIESKYGFNDRVTITFEVFLDADGEKSISLTEKFWVARSDDSRYYQLLSKLLQFDARLGFNIKELIGIVCEVDVVHNEISSGIYANISDLEIMEEE